jgi:oxygen-independent coproporphyrinogen-3 oxidase
MTVLEDLSRLRSAGISNLNIDLIAGLPHQSAESWEFSLAETIAAGVPHVSVYMLEVDEDSRLGRELLAGGVRYHAHFVPDEETMADFYLHACEQLNRAGIMQYEISNFSREGCESRHNLKYWTRLPYFGFGVDAHSMLVALNQKKVSSGDGEAVRFAPSDSLEKYMSGETVQPTPVSRREALEESFFLGLRLTRGINLRELALNFGEQAIENSCGAIADLLEGGLIQRHEDLIRLTPRGRLLSNEVFERFLLVDEISR